MSRWQTCQASPSNQVPQAACLSCVISRVAPNLPPQCAPERLDAVIPGNHVERTCAPNTELMIDATQCHKLIAKRSLVKRGACKPAAACLSYFWSEQLCLLLTCLLPITLWKEMLNSLNSTKELDSKTVLLSLLHLKKLKILSSCYMTTIRLLCHSQKTFLLWMRQKCSPNQPKWSILKLHSEMLLSVKQLTLLPGTISSKTQQR